MSLQPSPPEDVPLSQRDLAIVYAALVDLNTRVHYRRGEPVHAYAQAILDAARLPLQFHETNIGELMARLQVYMSEMR
jgi:phenylalanyl-tRNA synthetase beta subunit